MCWSPACEPSSSRMPRLPPHSLLWPQQRASDASDGATVLCVEHEFSKREHAAGAAHQLRLFIIPQAKRGRKRITLSVELRAHYIPSPWGKAGTSFNVVVYNRNWELSARERERTSVLPSLFTFRAKIPHLKQGEDSKQGINDSCKIIPLFLQLVIQNLQDHMIKWRMI